MIACKNCACLRSDLAPELHPGLRRQSVRKRFFDVFEMYECFECGSNWEFIILTADKYPIRYRWRLVPKPMKDIVTADAKTAGGPEKVLLSRTAALSDEAAHA